MERPGRCGDQALGGAKSRPPGRIAITCGPPIMIKFVLLTLAKLGYSDDQSLPPWRRMKCGIGKCGRCNIGGKYRVDGPVFTWPSAGAAR